jgi:site-specific DNA-methyltransferase (adenine-specific)
VKPIEVMRWLIRLACPEDGLVLDPFCGSGTTGAAATLEERTFIGIEKDESFAEIARARIKHFSGLEV